MPYLSQRDVEWIAQDAVAAYERLPEVDGEDRVDPEIFAQRLLGLTLAYRTLSPDGSILGATACEPIGVPVFNSPSSLEYFFLDGKTVLIERDLISEGANRGRYHFTLMHEACHQLLGMIFPTNSGGKASRRRVHYCREERAIGEDYGEEWRANALASAILMPQKMIRTNLNQFELGDGIQVLNRVYAPKEYGRFCEMADYMGVSHQALSIRLKQLGMLGENHLDDPFRMVNIFPGKEWDEMMNDE